MKKNTISLAVVFAMAASVSVFGAAPTVESYTVPALVGEINTGFTALYGSISTNTSTATVTVGALSTTGTVTSSSGILSDDLDAATATALTIGEAVATSVVLGATDAGVSIPGTLTMTLTPVFTAVVAAGAVTPAPTNMPTVVDETAPAWISVKIGATSYVVPAYAIP
jgi:hypothetical protein